MAIFSYLNINENLSLDGCWTMVNAIQKAPTAQGVRERCEIVKAWLKANKVINNDQFDELMRTVAYLYRESYDRG